MERLMTALGTFCSSQGERATMDLACGNNLCEIATNSSQKTDLAMANHHFYGWESHDQYFSILHNPQQKSSFAGDSSTFHF
jgi:hypothetical protein